MKNKNLLLILLGIVVIVGGIYFFTRDKGNVNQPGLGDNGQDQVEKPIEEKPLDPQEPVKAGGGNDIEVGKLSPPLAYKDKDGNEIKLKNLKGEEVKLEDYRGKIVLLNFWGTWCKWCDVEMPDLDKLDRENDDLVVLAVNVQENQKIVEDYMDKGGYGFEVAMDLEGQIAKKYLISSFPTSYFIDKEGILLGGISGMLEYEQMEEIISTVRANTQ